MPYLQVRGASIYYEEKGVGSETVVFIHGLMLASESFDAQIGALRSHYKIIAFDLRGQGQSQKTKDKLDLDSLAEDAVFIIENFSSSPVHVVAFSMGTFIAMRVAARRPELVRSICLIGPSADAEEAENLPKYRKLINFVRIFGPRLVANRLMMILFGDTFLTAADRKPQRQRWRKVVERLPRALHRAAAASAHRNAITSELQNITAPALIVSGEEDRPISPERARVVHAAIKNARFIAFEKTGHAVMIERPNEFNVALLDFLMAVDTQGERHS
ncbi:alpha/beta fold hydrolase [Asticcacaulis sp. AC402]|uniref:alpha/beta fold hydrolase n=1 Tax=Asticcacaulis sp. AC402 TaxID=1282361 RepID=UPI0003C3BEC7|nr:alpha/beta hydrolase [Asticcacaulis sp. AC402]ESQ73995.1 hypothetical protein ABAC402_16650 [Asticcacaulis sp. AC402]